MRLLRRLVTAGLVDFAGGERPVALLTGDGAAVMRGERPARLLLPSDGRTRPAGAGRRETRGGAASAPELDEAGRALFEALRRHRLQVARAEGVPPYVVATDRALRDVAALRPDDPEALARAHGLGPAKVRRYGAGLLEVVRRHRETPPG